MAFRGWKHEIACLLLRELDTKLSPLGYHVALQGGRRFTTSLELFLYPAVQEKDRAGIAEAIRSSDLHLVEEKSLDRAKKFGELGFRKRQTWKHGRGKSEKKIDIFIQAA